MGIFDSIKRLFGGSSSNGSEGDATDADMISCHEALSVIYEYLDGELEDVSREKVQAHFDVCARCYPHLRLEKSFRAAVQRAGAEAGAPSELKNRLMEILAAEGGGDD